MDSHNSQIDHRKNLEYLIKTSDLCRLTKYIKYLDRLQINLIKFNQPSLVKLAIDVYLNPKCMYNLEFQFDIIVLLLKLGLYFFVGKGSAILYVINLAEHYGIDAKVVYNLFKTMIETKHLEILSKSLIKDFDNIHSDKYKLLYDYLKQHYAAVIIQRNWNKTKN